jgi:hypothetical protein
MERGEISNETGAYGVAVDAANEFEQLGPLLDEDQIEAVLKEVPEQDRLAHQVWPLSSRGKSLRSESLSSSSTRTR